MRNIRGRHPDRGGAVAGGSGRQGGHRTILKVATCSTLEGLGHVLTMLPLPLLGEPDAPLPKTPLTDRQGHAPIRLRPTRRRPIQPQLERLLGYTADKLPEVTAPLDQARADVLTFSAFPSEVWYRVW